MTSGPSLGRKRPRRAAIARGATAPQQYATALHKCKGFLTHFRCKTQRFRGFDKKATAGLSGAISGAYKRAANRAGNGEGDGARPPGFVTRAPPPSDSPERESKTRKIPDADRDKGLLTPRRLWDWTRQDPANFPAPSPGTSRDGDRFYSLYWPPCDRRRGNHPAVLSDLVEHRGQKQQP